MLRSFTFLLLISGTVIAAEDENRPEGPPMPGTPLDAEERGYDRDLKEARREYLERRIKAHESYLEEIHSSKLSALHEGELHRTGRLEDQGEEIRRRLEADRAELREVRHDLLPPAAIALRGSGFEPKVLRNGATAYANRSYKWQEVPEGLRGWAYTQIDGGDTPDIRVEVIRDGVVYAMAEGSALEEHGWVRHGGFRFHWYPGRPAMTVFSKAAETGQVVEIPHFGWTGTLVLLPPEVARRPVATAEDERKR